MSSSGTFGTEPGTRSQATQATYENETTGVYFTFDYSSEDGDADEDAWASFNINYFRPSCFALEAAIELNAFVQRFGPDVSDPQLEGMGSTYSEDGFIRGWNYGNQFAFDSITTSEGGCPDPPRLPRSALAQTWRWNYARDDLQHQVGQEIFVPKIMFVSSGGAVLPVTVWGDGIPILLPDTPAVIIARWELAPMRWFRKKRDTVLVYKEQLAAVLKDFPQRTAELPARLLDYSVPPGPLVDWIKNLGPGPQIDGVPLDAILDLELGAKTH